MASVDIPQIMPTGDTVLYEDDTVEFLIGNDDVSDGLRLNLYIKEHEEFPNITPDDTKNCSLADGGRPSRLHELPSQYVEMFQDAAAKVEDAYGLAGHQPVICNSCVPSEEGDGFLTFIQHFD